MRDMFAAEDMGTFTGSWTGSVYVHDVRAVRITPSTTQPHHRQAHGLPLVPKEQCVHTTFLHITRMFCHVLLVMHTC